MSRIRSKTPEPWIKAFKGFKTAIIGSLQAISLSTREQYEALLETAMLIGRSDPCTKEIVNHPLRGGPDTRIVKEKRFTLLPPETWGAKSSIRKI